MKKALLLTMLVLGAFQAVAIPPRRVAFAATQSDGTTLMVYKCGDGHLAFYATTDGLALQRNANGDLCYARLENGHATPTDVVAHEASLRTADEASFIEQNALRVEDAMARGLADRKPAPARRVCYASTSDGLGKYGKSGMGAVSSIGDYTIPVLMVQFKDSKFKSTTTAAKMTRFYNEEGYHDESKCVGSVRDYFKSQSRGMFVPTFEIVGTVTLTQDTSYYGGNVTDRTSPWYGYDKGLCSDNYFVVDAVEMAVEQGIDFSKYEVNGKVPLISILYAGRGEATEDYGENYIWPCEFDIDQTIAGTHFNSYFVGNEIYYDGSLMGMGVFAHEFGHALGLPDFYCTDYSYKDTNPVGEWSIMDAGAYVNDARAPMGYTAYERSYLGWLDIPELKEAEAVTLDSYDDEGGTPARLLRNPSNNSEYFIFENHQAGTWYPSSYGSGMLVMRICYNKSEWNGNTLNNVKSKQRVKLITANGSSPARSGSKSSELYSYNGASRDVQTWPLYNGSSLAKPLYGIKKSNGKITFNFLEKEINTHAIGDTIVQDSIYYVLTSNTDVMLIGPPTSRYTSRMSVPETVQEGGHTYNVVSVASETFANSPELQSVSLPKSISYIEDGAFFNTPALDSIAVRTPNKQYRISDGALLGIYYPDETGTGTRVRPTVKSDDGETTIFDFTANSWGLPVSSSAAATAGELKDPIVVDGITMTATNGTTITRLWRNGTAIDLRVYNGGTLTFTSNSGAPITSIVATASKWNMTTNVGELEDNTWTGNAASVTFTATNTNNIQQMAVTVGGSYNQKQWTIIYYPTAREADVTIDGSVVKVEKGAYEDARVSSIHVCNEDMELTLAEDAFSTPYLRSLVVDYPTPPMCLGNPFAKIDFGACQLTILQGAESLYIADEFWKVFFDETSILPVELMPAENTGLFDLQGRRVNGQLPKGIYIVGGKKLIR